MYNVVKQGRRELEFVLFVVFYNGKEFWFFKMIGVLFDKVFYYEMIKEYLLDFNFLFEDVGCLFLEVMVKFEFSYFRSLLFIMLMWYKFDLIIQYLDVIFEGVMDKDKMWVIIIYILGVVEWLLVVFMKELE